MGTFIRLCRSTQENDNDAAAVAGNSGLQATFSSIRSATSSPVRFASPSMNALPSPRAFLPPRQGRRYSIQQTRIIQIPDWSSKSGPFSNKGESGAAIINGFGRIGGLLTGGTGPTESSATTYTTPIDFLLERKHSNGHKPNLNPIIVG